ncbi:hypothetical protein QZH41_020781 [Actinostola sp. cb2023]|nr:hypothetical protein QZH41_020781 [Actinostola sp. cb2023]
MAHLLGYESCLESLNQDVTDIQAVVTDITSRAGPVRSPSWKYPDKISIELDIEELLEIYCYSEDTDHCKLSHIVLFELVIDRLVLLLQGASQFVDQLLRSSDKEQRPGSSRTKTKADTLSKMEDTITDLRDEIKMLRKALDKKGEGRVVSGKIKGRGKSSTTSSAKFILSPTESLSFRSPSPANDITLTVEDVVLARTFQETSTQTYDTAFIPCEACSRTQRHLIDVGNMVMNLCESQGLPSSLAKQKKLLRKSLMAAADISRWTSEQNQDLARINNHLDNLYAQINPLEAKLQNSQDNCKHLKNQVQGLEEDLITEKTEGFKREESVKKEFGRIVEKKEVLLADANDSNKELKQGNEVLQEKTSELSETITKQEETLSGLEKQNSQLKTDLENESSEVKRLQKVDKDILSLKVELNEVHIKLQETSLELDKSQAKNRSLVKHEQALQNKHDALLQRVDELDNECEDLRERLMDAENERDDLQDALGNRDEEHVELNKRLEENKKIINDIQEEKKLYLKTYKNFRKVAMIYKLKFTTTKKS